MPEGRIRKVDVERNFGFVRVPGYDRDLFFHAGEVNGMEFDHQLRERLVLLDVEDGPKGPRAVNVRPLP